MRPFGTPEELQRRRLRAVGLLKAGRGPTEVAEAVSAHRRTVQRWARRFERGGKDSLQAIPHLGPKPKLTAGQKRHLIRLLLKGAKANGFGTDLWTLGRMGKVIYRRFGVSYDISHISRLLKSLGWSPQKPRKKAYERDEKAIQRWVEKDWPGIKKSPKA